MENARHHKVERLLAESPAAQAALREIRELAGLLTTELKQEPALSLTAVQRIAILEDMAARMKQSLAMVQ